jgi:hypothetical protein
VALRAKPEQLLELSERLKMSGIKHMVIREDDPPYTDEVMAIGVCPGLKEDLRRHFSNFALI